MNDFDSQFKDCHRGGGRGVMAVVACSCDSRSMSYLLVSLRSRKEEARNSGNAGNAGYAGNAEA